MSKIFSITEGLENMGALRTGGQGSVYKGRRMGPVISAVKVLPTPIYAESDDDKNFKSFQNEVEKLRKVNEEPNPNVVKILNSGLTESGSLPYIEMEFIEGPDLEDLLKPPHDGIFTIKEVIKMADHLANALAHCHRFGVKHGDVKSNNVKYNIHSGNYVLLDFGLAIMSDEQRRTSIRHAGAIEFMAPEQNTGTMLFQTDVYSFGIILFELLAGRVPFPLQDNGETARNAVMIAHMETPVPDLLTLRKENLPENWPVARQQQETRVPQWLLQLVLTCLEKKPENRHKDGIALQQAFINGSVAADSVEILNKNIFALQAENDRLTGRLADYRQLDEIAKRQIHLTKPYFAAAVAVMAASLVFGSYYAFKKTVIPLPKHDTVIIKQPVIVYHTKSTPLKVNKSDFNFPKDSTDSGNFKNREQDSTKKALAHHKKHKPKRKKFLGLF